MLVVLLHRSLQEVGDELLECGVLVPCPPAPPGRSDDGRAVRLNEVVLLSAGGLQLVPAHADVSV